MRINPGAVAIIAVLSTAAPALGLSYGDYMRGRAQDPKFAGSLIITMGQSFTFANAMLSHEGKEPLYCPPPNVKFGAEGYDDILDGYVSASPASSDASVEGLLLFAMKNAFPC